MRSICPEVLSVTEKGAKKSQIFLSGKSVRISKSFNRWDFVEHPTLKHVYQDQFEPFKLIGDIIQNNNSDLFSKPFRGTVVRCIFFCRSSQQFLIFL